MRPRHLFSLCALRSMLSRITFVVNALGASYTLYGRSLHALPAPFHPILTRPGIVVFDQSTMYHRPLDDLSSKVCDLCRPVLDFGRFRRVRVAINTRSIRFRYDTNVLASIYTFNSSSFLNYFSSELRQICPGRSDLRAPTTIV